MWAPLRSYAMGAGRGLLSVCQLPSTAQGGDTRAFKPLGRDHGWVVGCIRGHPKGCTPCAMHALPGALGVAETKKPQRVRLRLWFVDGGQVSPNPAVCRLIGGVSLNHHNCGLQRPACVSGRLWVHRKGLPPASARQPIRMCDGPTFTGRAYPSLSPRAATG